MSTTSADLALSNRLIESGLQAQRSGDHARAAECYERVLTFAPHSFDALQLLGLLKVQTGLRAAGIELLERAVAVDSGQICVLNNLGNALLEAGRLREAVNVYAQALAVEPENVTVLTNLALALLRVGEYRFAARCIERATGKDPKHPPLLFALGHLLHATRRPSEAAGAYRKALELGLADAGTRLSLGLALQDLKDEQGAHEQFSMAEQLSPTVTLRAFRAYAALQYCHWERFADDTAFFEAEGPRPGEAPLDPMRAILLPISGRQLRRYAEQHAADLVKTAQALPKAAWVPPQPSPESKRLRIGYLSPDFRAHAVGHLVCPILAGHDRGRFEIFAYGWGPPDAGGTRERIAAGCDRFHAVDDLTDEELLSRLREDRIDIAVDLAGYTAHHRAALFAARVAPLQVGWLGYPGTTGGTFLDYVVCDDFIVPRAHQTDFTESVIRLPHTYLAYDPHRPVAAPLARAEYGLPPSAVVLACLGQVRKINPLVFEPWMTVLREQPSAVLWLASTYAPAIENLRREAEARGVSGDRLVFAKPVASHADHLARYRVVDVALDTFPYGSHTTAADALCAGCPLVAVIGESFASRVSGSILRAAGLPELVTESLDAYRALLLELARDAGRREQLRARLAAVQSTSPLFDIGRFVRGLELAYTMIWQRRQQGEAPAALAVSEEAAAAS